MKILFFTFLLILSFSAFSQELPKDEGITKRAPASESKNPIKLDSLKEILRNDQLAKESKKKKIIKKKKSKKRRYSGSKHKVPNEEEIWTFLTEYWLVKKAPDLTWDFKKPDYGLNISFAEFLERLGHFEKSFKILVVNTPRVFHMGLPGKKGEYIFLISLPFMKTLDLTKLEISLLLFEDFLRLEKGYFKDQVSTKEFKALLGRNFYKKPIDLKIFENLWMNYDKVVFEKGFSFQQQFEVTTSMGNFLKTNLKLWNVYYNLIKKIDQLVKSNILFKDYLKIYPSPELQLSWLTPAKR